ncbi:MAG: hypothetical protein WDW36_009469 [Sanguina aurantia]
MQSAVPAYKPDGCACKPDLTSPAFILMVVLALVTLLVSILSSCYFGGRSPRFSPYRKAEALGIQMAAL